MLNACDVWSFQAPFKFMFCMLARHKMRLEQQLEHGIFIISLENHAPPFAMSSEQQLEHGLCLFAAHVFRSFTTAGTWFL